MTHNICIKNDILDIGQDEKYYYEENTNQKIYYLNEKH